MVKKINKKEHSLNMNNNDFRELRNTTISLMENDYGEFLVGQIRNKNSIFKSLHFYKYHFITNFVIKLIDQTNIGTWYKSDSPAGTFYAFHFNETDLYKEFVWFVFNYEDFRNISFVDSNNLDDEKILELISDKQFKNDFVIYTGNKTPTISVVSELGFPSIEVDERKFKFTCEEKCSAFNLLGSPYTNEDNQYPDIFQILNIIMEDSNLYGIYSNHIKNSLVEIEETYKKLIDLKNFAPYKDILIDELERVIIDFSNYEAAINEYNLNSNLINLNEIETKRIHAFIHNLSEDELNTIMLEIKTYRSNKHLETSIDYVVDLTPFYKIFENVCYFVFRKYWFNSFAIKFQKNQSAKIKVYNLIAENDLEKWPIERYGNQVDNDRIEFIRCFECVREKSDDLKIVTRIYLKDVSNGYRHKEIMKLEDVPNFISYVLLCIRLYIIVFTNVN